MLEIPFCVEITTLGNVRLPGTVRCFDCRVPDDLVFAFVTPWGTKPMGSERAEIVLGLRGPGFLHHTIPVGMSGYTDLRTAGDEKLAEIAKEWTKTARDYRRQYRDALKRPADGKHGGSCHYLPIAFALCNYGWSMIADRRIVAVAAFDGDPIGSVGTEVQA